MLCCINPDSTTDIINSYKKESLRNILTRWRKIARIERVASIARQTAARRSMIHHTTLCIETASPWAWVHTFVSYTCSCFTAICIQNTLWSTASVRIS